MDSVAKCYEALSEYCKAMAVLGIDSAEFEITEIRKIARQAQEQKAAELLPLGAPVVAERQQCHRSTAYRRSLRWLQKVAKLQKNATTME